MDAERETELSEPVTTEADSDAGHRAPPWPIAQYRFLRQWLARGRQDSKFWVPRVGDRVRLHGRGTWLVFEVSIRRGEVRLNAPGLQRLFDVAPALREDLEALYSESVRHRLDGQRDLPIPQAPASQDAGTEEESPRLRAVPNLDETAGDGRETEIQ